MNQIIWSTAIIFISMANFTQAWDLKCFCGSLENYLTVNLDNATTLVNHNDCFNTSLSTFIYAFGYRESLKSNSTVMVLNTYISFKDRNICVVDWTIESNFGPSIVGYPIVVQSALSVGTGVGNMIVTLSDAGMSLGKLQLCGHSLGAHLMGAAGRQVKDQSGKQVARITGLDSAGPLFEGLTQIQKRLDKYCAVFVDNHHTDPAKYGMKEDTGTVDFYVNYGFFVNGTNKQPGCPEGIFEPLSKEDLCSHIRSWQLLIQARLTPFDLLASTAPDYDAWKANDGAQNQVTYVGDQINTSYSGKYFYNTNAQVPYGRGLNGLK